jgi:aryl-alcohol dehydrogenase-like predicted oxidoreductase
MPIAIQPFGRTGHMSTRTIFGAASLSHVTQEEADRTLQVLLQYGINHIDVAANYGDAELRIAPWLARYRAQFYVATKTDARTAQEATEDLHRSLKRMGIDYVDTGSCITSSIPSNGILH